MKSVSHAERLKTNHLPFMRAIHAAIRRYPGGYAELALAIGRNQQTLINQFNPDALDSAPAADLLLDVIEAVRPVNAVDLLAGYVGRSLGEPAAAGGSGLDDEAHFHAVLREMTDVMRLGLESLQDKRFDAAERRDMLPELQELIDAANAFKRRMMRADEGRAEVAPAQGRSAGRGRAK